MLILRYCRAFFFCLSPNFGLCFVAFLVHASYPTTRCILGICAIFRCAAGWKAWIVGFKAAIFPHPAGSGKLMYPRRALFIYYLNQYNRWKHLSASLFHQLSSLLTAVFFSFCLFPQETSSHCCSRGCYLYPSQTDHLSALLLWKKGVCFTLCLPVGRRSCVFLFAEFFAVFVSSRSTLFSKERAGCQINRRTPLSLLLLDKCFERGNSF